MKLASQAVFAVAIAAAVAGGLFFLVRASIPSGGTEIILPTPAPDDVQVYVTGAVSEPGVYTIGAGARLLNAIEAAGGADDGVLIQVLGPPTTLIMGSDSDVNNASVVLRIVYGRVSFLLAGVSGYL